MKRCKRCVMPDTRPGIKFDKNGVCYPCLSYDKRKSIDWDAREKELLELCNKYRRNDGSYDCIIPSSGGKDSTFQTYIMKELCGMNPLLVVVSDWFTHTETGKHNLKTNSEAFDCDIIKYNQNPDTLRRMMRIAFEEMGSPTWPIDRAIYTVPLIIAKYLNIQLIVYGENISYEYGGPNAKETYSALYQINNDVVKSTDWDWWFTKGIFKNEISMLKYPDIKGLEPIYLSYFYPWDGYNNYKFALQYGFKTLDDEWVREGFAENFDQLDTIGYLLHPWLKYPKFGHNYVSDRVSNAIRSGRISRDEGIKIVREKEGKLDDRILSDFLRFTGYTEDEFWNIVEKFWNKDIFDKVDGEWRLKELPK